MIAGQLEIQLMADVARIRSDMDKAMSIVQRGSKAMEDAAARARAALGGIGGGLSAAAFGSWIKGAIDLADNLNDLSKSTDIAVGKLSGLKMASKQSGADLEGTAQAINKLSLNMGKNAEKFAAIGITAKDPLEAFKQLSDVFRSIQDPQLRAAVAAEALGKSWAGAAPLLSEGGKKIQEMVDKGELLSGMNQSAADAADEFNDRLVELQTALSGTALKIAAGLLPIITALTEDMGSAAEEANKLGGAFNPLNETLRALIVFGGNVAFVIKAIGIEIGGMAAQLATLMSGDLKGAISIGEAMRADAEKGRAAFDAWEAKMMAAGTTAKATAVDAAKASVGLTKVQQDALKAFSDSEASKKDAEAMKKAAAEAKKLSEAYDSLIGSFTGKDAGVDADFIKNLKLINDEGRKRGQTQERINELSEQYIAKQPFMLKQEKDALAISEARQKARIAEDEGIKKHFEALDELNAKQLKDGKELLDQLEYDTKLLGLNAQEREVAIVMRDLENKGIKAGTEAYEKYGIAIRAAVVNKAAADEHKRVWDSIDATAHDVFVNIFDGGSNAFKKLGQTLKASVLDLLYQMTIKKWIINFAASGTGQGISGMVSGQGGGGMMSMASNGMSLYNAGSSLYSVGGQVMGGSMSMANGAGTLYANATGTGIDGLLAANAAYGTAGGGAAAGGAAAAEGGAAAAGGMGGMGAAAGAAAAVLVVAFVLAKMANMHKGEKRGGATFDFDALTGASAISGAASGDRDAGTDDLVKTMLAGTSASLNDAFKSFGSDLRVTGVRGAYETSASNRGGVFSGVTLSDGRMVGEGGAGTNYEWARDPMNSKYELWGSTGLYESNAPIGRQVDMSGNPAELATDLQQSFIAAIQASAGIIPQIIAESFKYQGVTFGNGPDGEVTTGEMGGTRILRVFDQEMKDRAKELALLPKRIMDLIIDVDPEALSAEATAELTSKVSALIASVNGFRAIVGALPMEQLKNASFDTAAALVEMAGGLTAFSSSLGTYYENFYTEAEKQDVVWRQLVATFTAAGVVLPANRDAFRAMVDSLDLTTEAGQHAYTVLMANVGAFTALYPAAEAAGEAISSSLDAVVGARRVLIQQYEEEQGALQATVTRLRDFANNVREFRDSLLLSDGLSPLTPQEKYSEALRQFSQIKTQADGGDVNAQGQLQGAAQAVLEASRVMFGSSAQYTADFSLIQQALTDSATHAAAGADVAQLQLDAVNSLIAPLLSIDQSVVTLASAMLAYQDAVVHALAAGLNVNQADQAAAGAGPAGQLVASMYQSLLNRAPEAQGLGYWTQQLESGASLDAVIQGIKNSDEYFGLHGSHAAGLDYVPRDGYRAELHVGDSGEVVKALQTLIARVEQLEQSVVAGDAMNADATLHNGSQVSTAVRDTASRQDHGAKLARKAELV